MNATTNKPATWFWVVAIVTLLWNLIGVMTFVMHINMTQETLDAMPEGERALYADFPMWVTIVYAVAVFGGILGSVLLLLRKKLATPILLISFVAILAQMFYTVALSKSIEVHGPSAVGLPIVIAAIGGFLVWFSRKADGSGWLS